MAVASSCGGFFIHRLFYVLPNPLNRITAATDNTQRFGLSNLKYDKNGNITHLTRGGHLKEMPDWDKDDDFGTMDQLDYQYFDGGNRLRSVTDGILKNDTSGKGEFVDGNKDGDDYVYDPNGNMISDANKGITGIDYNFMNLPVKVTVSGNGNNGTIDYIYSADGTKLKKTTSTGLEVDYASGYVYNNDELQFFPHPEGYVSVENGNYEYVYNYFDHLGNVRLSYSDADGNGSIDPANEIIEENNYYPMGMKHKGYNEVVSPLGNSIAKKWKFQGVEFEDALDIDLYEMEFRNYDPAIGRFMTIDPLAEEREWLTPYNFVQNNPILRVDPSGLLDDYGLDTDTGSLVLLKVTGEDTDTIYTGTWENNEETGEAEFKKDGKRKSFSTKASNIKEVVSNGLDDVTPEESGDASNEGLTFNEGYEQTGLEVMEFISFSAEIELNAWEFDTKGIEGTGLAISPWIGNEIQKSSDVVGFKTGDNVIEASGKNLGKKVAKVHTHPGSPDRIDAGYGKASGPDKTQRNKPWNSKYPHYINSRYDGWKPY